MTQEPNQLLEQIGLSVDDIALLLTSIGAVIISYAIGYQRAIVEQHMMAGSAIPEEVGLAKMIGFGSILLGLCIVVGARIQRSKEQSNRGQANIIVFMVAAYSIGPIYLAIIFGLEVALAAGLLLAIAIVYSNIRYYIRSATGFQ